MDCDAVPETFDPLKYTMGSPILIVSLYMGKSIRIQRDKDFKIVFSLTFEI